MFYKVDGDEDGKFIKFSYYGNDSEKIMENGGKAMLEELYKEFMIEKDDQDPNMHITLKIEGGNLPKTSKISKKMDEETADKTRDENEVIRLKRKDIVTPIANKIANLR